MVLDPIRPMLECSKAVIIDILRRCEVFMGLDDSDLEKVASLPSIRIESFELGETIAVSDQPAKNLYILVDGKVGLRLKVELARESETREIKVDTVSKGSVFGWSALVQPYAYSRTSVCSEKCVVLTIDGKELIELMNNDEHVGYELMRSIACVIASRLRTPNNYFWAELLKARNGATE